MIKDSGERREFESGAVRDMVGGKGRCDLLPLDAINTIYASYIKHQSFYNQVDVIEYFQQNINLYLAKDTDEALVTASVLIVKRFWGEWETAMLELSKHFEEGAKKYGEYNWQKGIPIRSYLDSALRHFYKHMRGDADEPHDRACLWNLVCAIWTHNNIPEMRLEKQYEDYTERRTDGTELTGESAL